MYVIKSLATVALCSILGVALGCGKHKKSDSTSTDSSGSAGTGTGSVGVSNVALKIDAKGVDSTSSSLRLSSNESFGLTSTDPYPGIGVNSGETIVDSLKIWLTGLTLNNQVDSNSSNTSNRTASVADWSAAPKELQIAKGYAGTFNETIKTYIKPGDYNQMSISMLDKMSIKAYAYLDTNNDGTIDATIYTTATRVTKVASVLDPASMPSDYDYYVYGYINALTADSLTASTKTSSTLTVFDQPVTIPTTDVDAKAAAGEKVAASTVPPFSLSLSLVVDTTYLIKVWDGRFGTSSATSLVRGDGKVPPPVFPFPMDNIPANSRRHDVGLTQLDFYPEGKPAFGVGNYIPMFGFANVGKATFGVFAFSLDQNFDSFWSPTNAGGFKKTLILTLAYDSTGKPLLSRTTSLAESLNMFIGALGRVFEKQSDGTYTFYTNYGVKDASGKDDGGLYYHSDKTMAGHSFSGFKANAAVGDTFQVIQNDGPRCNAEYNYCVGSAGRSLWVKRLK